MKRSADDLVLVANGLKLDEEDSSVNIVPNTVPSGKPEQVGIGHMKKSFNRGIKIFEINNIRRHHAINDDVVNHHGCPNNI